MLILGETKKMERNSLALILVVLLMAGCSKVNNPVIENYKKDLQQEQVSQQVMQPMSKADIAWRNAGIVHTESFMVLAATLITVKVCSLAQTPFPLLVASAATQMYLLGSGIYYGAKGVYYSLAEKVQG